MATRAGDEDVARADGDRGALDAGAQVGRYAIAGPLGAGAMGVVYAARDSELGRDVALKLLHARDGGADEVAARLRREARAMARLSHANVVPVFDIGTHEGQLYLAMELVAGPSLRTWLAQPRSWREVVAVFARAGRGLAAAHHAGLVHRDFKPENVVVGPDGEPRITDFGLARESGAAADSTGRIEAAPSDGSLGTLTATGALAGTPAYMAPEQLLGRAPGPAADQFSFAVALFEALHGTRPFAPALPEAAALIAEVRARRIVRPPAGSDVPRAIDAALVRALHVDPAQRWPSMAALIDAIEPVVARRSHNATAALLGGVAVLLAAAAPGPADCDRVHNELGAARALRVCEAAYRIDPTARRKAARDEAALRAANGYDGRRDAGDTAMVRGREDTETAKRIAELENAYAAHLASREWARAARDAAVRAGEDRSSLDGVVWAARGVALALRGASHPIEAYARTSLAQILGKLHAFAAAERELELAAEASGGAVVSSGVLFYRGNLAQERGDHAQAVVTFGLLSFLARCVSQKSREVQMQLNLAYSLIALGQLDAAERAIARVDELGGARSDAEDVRAHLALARGDVVAARRASDAALRGVANGSDSFERLLLRAEIGYLAGDYALADQLASRALETVAAPSHSALGDRRLAFEVVFASRARRGDGGMALHALEDWSSRAALDRELRDRLAAASGPVEIERVAAEFSARRPQPGLDSQVLRLARRAPLVAIVAARGRVWQLTVAAGEPALTDLGAGDAVASVDVPASTRRVVVEARVAVPLPAGAVRIARPSDP